MRIAAVLLLLTTTFAIAQAPASPQAPPPVPEAQLPALGQTEALDAGERAPWAGMLVRDDDLFGLQSALMTCRFTLASDQRLAAQVLDARLEQERARTAAATESAALHDRLWSERADQLAAQVLAAQRSAERQWWESPPLWFAVGLVVATAAAVALALAFGG
jgi:hypothetical protein